MRLTVPDTWMLAPASGVNLGPKVARYAHILALHDLDRAAMRPCKVAQVASPRGRGGARSRIFVHAARCKRVAGMAEVMCLGVDQTDSSEPVSQHKLPPFVQIITHRRKLPPIRKRKREMPRVGFDHGWRKTKVKIGRLVAE